MPSAGPSRSSGNGQSTIHSEKKNVVVAAHGRAPWYGPDGKNVEAYVIGIAGGSASGKVSKRSGLSSTITAMK